MCLRLSNLSTDESKEKCVDERRCRKMSTGMLTHLTRMKYVQSPLWSPCMKGRKTTSIRSCMRCRKNRFMTNSNDNIMKLKMKMKVDRLKLINFVLFIFNMFDKEWLNSNLKVIYIKFSLCIDYKCVKGSMLHLLL